MFGIGYDIDEYFVYLFGYEIFSRLYVFVDKVD